MPKVVETFEFKKSVGAGKKVYDWDGLMDGKIYAMEEGDDFTCTPESFRQMLYSRAEARGKSVRVDISDNETGPKTVTFQAITLTDEDIASRAAARETRKAIRAAKNGHVAPDATTGDDTDTVVPSEPEHTPEPDPEPEPLPPPPVAPAPKPFVKGKKPVAK